MQNLVAKVFTVEHIHIQVFILIQQLGRIELTVFIRHNRSLMYFA